MSVDNEKVSRLTFGLSVEPSPNPNAPLPTPLIVFVLKPQLPRYFDSLWRPNRSLPNNHKSLKPVLYSSTVWVTAAPASKCHNQYRQLDLASVVPTSSDSTSSETSNSRAILATYIIQIDDLPEQIDFGRFDQVDFVLHARAHCSCLT